MSFIYFDSNKIFLFYIIVILNTMCMALASVAAPGALTSVAITGALTSAAVVGALTPVAAVGALRSLTAVGALTSVATVGARQNSLRSVGGRDAQPGEYPYVVRLTLVTDDVNLQSRINDNHLCTASVISPTVTLTAAHCCIKEVKIVVRYGSDSRPSESDRFSEVLDCIELPVPRNYLRYLMIDDLALLRTEPIILRSYARLSALDPHTMYGHHVSILAHGMTNHSDNSAEYSTLKLKMPLQVLNVMWSHCEKYLRPSSYPLVCVKGLCGRDVALCPGDSGGPVLHSSGVVGVVSRATHQNNCYMGSNRFRFPLIGLFSPLGSNIDWISDRISEINRTSW